MDEEMGIMETDDASFSEDFDSDYEFDAYHHFDFSREETESEAEEAEGWFRYAHEYPPSPFIVKLKLMKATKSNHMKVQKTSSKKVEANKKMSASIIFDGETDHKAASREMNMKGVKHHNHIPQDNIKSTVNLSKPSGSSFMKPTASHLAKQNKEFDIPSGGFGRLQKPIVSAAEKLRSPIRVQNQTTKRQKLEIGYLRKAAQLKHRATFLHKNSKKAVQLENSSNSRVKTTIPKKPGLTQGQAQMRMSQNNSESIQRPLSNKKILDVPTLPQYMKSMMQSNEFQVLYKLNSASPLSEDIIKRQNSGNAGKKDKCRSPNNLKSFTTDKVYPVKYGGFRLNAKHNPHQPPIELFKKLSLKPEPETKAIRSLKPPHLTKGLKENVPGSYQQDFQRCVGKPNHRRIDRMITEVKI